MLVDNKRLRIICLTGAHEGGLLRSVDLRPGINRVDPKEWERVAECRATYSKEDFEVIGAKDELSGSQPGQLQMIARTTDKNVLKDWAEARDAKGTPVYAREVRDAIETQLDALKIKTAE